MTRTVKYVFATWLLLAGSSCSTVEKASLHGFTSGYYTLAQTGQNKAEVYAEVTESRVDIYRVTNRVPQKDSLESIALGATDTMAINGYVFTKNSHDIDITAILLKYRPAVYGLPAQMIADYNMAFYAGRRHDTYTLKGNKDPLGRMTYTIAKRGFDYGIFAGPGASQISPFSTANRRDYDYNGFIMQTGAAAFLESDIASFGIAAGFDFLLNKDRRVWIYQRKPWIGFVVGIALN